MAPGNETLGSIRTGVEAAGLCDLHIRANMDGEEPLGERAEEGGADSPARGYCRMDVPAGTTVVVWLDPESIAAGYTPVENSIAFDTTYPTTTPHKIDVASEREASGR